MAKNEKVSRRFGAPELTVVLGMVITAAGFYLRWPWLGIVVLGIEASAFGIVMAMGWDDGRDQPDH